MILVFITHPQGGLFDIQNQRQMNRGGKHHQIAVGLIDGLLKFRDLVRGLAHGRID